MQSSAIIIERSQFFALKKHLNEKEITVLLGPRQVGKTTLMNLLRNHLVMDGKASEKNIHYFNLDIVTDMEFFISQPKFVRFCRERTKNGNFIYVFIDEAQRINETGLFLKGIYDLNLPLKLVISGSSALELKEKIGEPLTGRKKVFKILPLSFDEFFQFKNNSLRKLALESGVMREEETFEVENIFQQYLIFGGYPRVVVENSEEEKKSILEEIFTSYIDKDIIKFLKVRDPLSFSGFVRYLAIQNGGLMNVNEASKTLNINQRTARKYLHYLESTFVIKKLSPFFTNAMKELVKMPKVYFLDLGLRNFVVSDFLPFSERSDRGALLENFVLNEMGFKLKLAEKINFWRSKDGRHEVDFVVRRGGDLVPIEVKSSNNDLKINSGYKGFLEQYKPQKGFFVIGEGKEGEIKKDGSKIGFVLAHKLSAIDL